MRAKFSDIVFVACCVTLSSVAVARYLSPPARPAAREGVVSGVSYSAVAGGEHEYTAVVYIQPDCPFCTEALPLYRRLAAAAGETTAVRFQGPVAPELLKTYLERSGLDRPTLATGPIPPGVRGTPTVVVFDRSGRAVASWEGRLNARQERTLLEYFRPRTTRPPAS